MQKTTLLSILFILSGWSADAGEIRLREKAECSSGIVRLGDVADVYGPDALTTKQIAALALFPTPSGERPRTLRRQELQELLVLSEIPLKDYRFTGAEAASVRAAKADRNVSRPATAQPVIPTGNTTDLAAANVQLAVYTVRPLRQGMVIQASDVQLQPVSRSTGNTALAGSLEEIVGKELTRSLAAGQPVAPDLLQMPRLVQRGEVVSVHSIAAGVLVKTSGKALEAGGKGDVIQVEMIGDENHGSRARIFARVIDHLTVAVYAKAPTFAGAKTQTK